MFHSDEKIVVLTGGGTAGHIFPLMAVAQKIKKTHGKIKFVYFGSGAAIEKRIAQKENIPYCKIFCGKFRRNFSINSIFLNIFDFFKSIFGFFQAFVFLFNLKPTVIFSKGGFVSLPTTLAAAVLHIPIISHESDLIPGLSTRLIFPFVRRLGLAFPVQLYPEKYRRKAFYCGIPLREEFERNWEKRDIAGDYILVVGGSSGAVALNSLIFEIAPKILEKEKIIHLTGEQDEKRARYFCESLPPDKKKKYTVLKFSDEMPKLIREAKLVISRSGATAIFEVAASRKKAIFVPIASNVASHQFYNALFLKEAHFAQMHLQNQPSFLLYKKIESALSSRETSIGKIYFPKSAELLAQIILDEIQRLDFRKIKSVFLIGAAGVSMKGLGVVLQKLGKKVRGSDLKMGGHSASNIVPGIDLVVYSSAAGYGSPAEVELKKAEELDIKIMKRSEAIGWLMRGARGISVSGMHGKTTVTTLIARIFEAAGLDPSYLIGAEPTRQNPTYNLGKGNDFIVEACEYDDSFLDFPTQIAVVTNIEEEHLDFFKGGISQIKEHFEKFICNIYAGGVLVFCADDPNVSELVKNNSSLLAEKRINTLSYGFGNKVDFAVSQYKVQDKIASFKISFSGEEFEFKTKVIGKHFALNAAAAAAVAISSGISIQAVATVVENYTGASRRFELMGQKNGVLVYSDYAHHPTEIKATLEALNEMYPKSRKLLIFEPHQQSRLNHLFPKFVEVFERAKVDFIGILPAVVIAGRDEKAKYSSQDLVAQIKKRSKIPSALFANYDEVLLYLKDNLKKGDVLMTMGATDVFKIGKKYLS